MLNNKNANMPNLEWKKKGTYHHKQHNGQEGGGGGHHSLILIINFKLKICDIQQSLLRMCPAF